MMSETSRSGIYEGANRAGAITAELSNVEPDRACAPCVTPDCDQGWWFGVFVLNDHEYLRECAERNHETWDPDMGCGCGVFEVAS